MSRRFSAAAACLCYLSGGAIAEVLTDPTRPPAAILNRAEGTASAIPTPRLQSILIAPGRRLAIINGVTVALHGRFGDAVLVAIGESQVTLRSGRTETILTLYPVSLKPAVRPVTPANPAPSSYQARHPS